MFFSKRLVQLIALSENESLSGAAEAINITPSAISQGLTSLEKEFGRRLLIKKNKIHLSNYGLDLVRKIHPHYKAINEIVLEFSEKTTINKKVLTDGFPFTNVYSTLNKHGIKTNIENLDITCDISHDILHDIKNKHYDIIISPNNIDVINTNVKKINLASEKIGIAIHEALLSKNISIESVMNKKPLIHTDNSLNHVLMINLLKKLKKNGVFCKTISINEIELFHFLKNKIGYSFVSEEFFNKFSGSNSGLIFLHSKFNLYLNRKIYFLNY
ncbi:LysR family transcriptional regulator (plasmid) [Yersinia sp. HM-2024]|uniref:LysR family transcriptional regulator n=1 Tax=Yersinia sp. HM-2024 TaxID=3344550 RepID=UPI00370DB288